MRRQVTELPEVSATITEYRIHTLECPCGHHTRAEIPQEAEGCFGPRLAALVSLLTGGYRMSKRNVQELLGDVLGVDLALGSVSKLEGRASQILAAPHAEVLAHVRSAPHVNMDETSWTEERLKWVASTPQAVYYRIEAERSSDVVTEILGSVFAGVVSNDRAKAYLVPNSGLHEREEGLCRFVEIEAEHTRREVGRRLRDSLGLDQSRSLSASAACARRMPSSSRLASANSWAVSCARRPSAETCIAQSEREQSLTRAGG